VTIDYDSAGEGDYDANKSWLERQGHDLLSEADAMAAISSARTSGHRLRIDISSMKRTTIARIVEALWENPATEPVQFVYAPALYEASSSGISNDMALQAGPVTPFFGGALRPTSTPLGLIAGLGFEPHRVLGLTELLEPAQVWAFLAVSEDRRFQAAVREVNLPTLANQHNYVHEYDVRSIADTYSAVESLVYAAGQSHRLVLAPSGPKMFALVCMLVAASATPQPPAVWRVGGVRATAQAGLRAAGDVVAVNVEVAR
jgi:hypothetical protein